MQIAFYFAGQLKKILVFYVLFGLNQLVLAQQVINIESKRYDRLDSGWHGIAELNFNYLQNQNQIINAGNKLDVMYVKDIQTYLFINDINFIRLNNTNLDYNTYQHFRYKRQIKDWLHGEAFAQTQFNQQFGLNFRGLLGAGPRIRLMNADSVKIFIGPMWMYEYEVEKPNNTQVVTNRLSFYFSVLFLKNHNFTVNILGYYQPDLANFADFRISSDLRLEFKINRKYAFRSSASQSYDSKPPPNIPNNFINLKNSFVYYLN